MGRREQKANSNIITVEKCSNFCFLLCYILPGLTMFNISSALGSAYIKAMDA